MLHSPVFNNIGTPLGFHNTTSDLAAPRAEPKAATAPVTARAAVPREFARDVQRLAPTTELLAELEDSPDEETKSESSDSSSSPLNASTSRIMFAVP